MIAARIRTTAISSIQESGFFMKHHNMIGNGVFRIWPKHHAKLRWQLICKRIDTMNNGNVLQTNWLHQNFRNHEMFTRPSYSYLNQNQSNH